MTSNSEQLTTKVPNGAQGQASTQTSQGSHATQPSPIPPIVIAPLERGGSRLIGTNTSKAQAASLLSDWRLTPATLMSSLDPSWIPAKWLQYLSFKIAKCVARGNCGLLISAPPRHGKSMLSTIATPTWVLENFPHKQVVLSTYGEELSTDFSRQIRDLITNNPDKLSVRLRSDTQRVTNFLTTKGGGLKAVGLRGAITGRGADVFIVDDYIKEPKEALSPSYLEDLYTWYTTVARTRLEPGAVVIILATRWVPNDLHGQIMARQAATGRNFFEYVELPAICDPRPGDAPDPMGRLPGEVLFPERYNAEAIDDIRADLGTRWFQAMFQQRPPKTEGNIVDRSWFKLIRRNEFEQLVAEARTNGQKSSWVRAWDLASTKDAGDFTAGVRAWYNTVTEEFYIDNVSYGQHSSAKVEANFQLTTELDALYINKVSPETAYKVGIEQEPGSSGAYTIRHFEQLARKVVRSLHVVAHRATTSKQLNAQPLLAGAEHGRVYMVNDHPTEIDHWIKIFLDEFENFPEAKHDDQVDAASQAYKLATGKKGFAGSFGRNASGAGTASNTSNSVKLAEGDIKLKASSTTFGRR